MILNLVCQAFVTVCELSSHKIFEKFESVAMNAVVCVFHVEILVYG